MTAIQFDAVCLRLGDRTILNDVSFAIAQGEFIGLLGANGAGKTTLMRAALGLVGPASGRITVNGKQAKRGDPSIGYMPQVRTTPHHRLSGADFIASACNGARWGVPRIRARDRAEIAHVLELVQAADLADRPIVDLSGGERQRLLLAQALLGGPSILLLDEPLMSLDPRHQAGVVTLVRRLQRDLGITVLFSTHELNPLLGAMDRVLYLGSSQAELGTVDQVITASVLTRLYGAPIDVVRANGRVFVTVADV